MLAEDKLVIFVIFICLDPYDDDLRTLENASKLSNIRMKLEEKRLRIEQDKRRIEVALLRHQEKVAFEAFSSL